jgi:hypothetical protein
MNPSSEKGAKSSEEDKILDAISGQELMACNKPAKLISFLRTMVIATALAGGAATLEGCLAMLNIETGQTAVKKKLSPSEVQSELLIELKANSTGLQDDGLAVNCAEGSTEVEAKAEAESKNKRELLESKIYSIFATRKIENGRWLACAKSSSTPIEAKPDAERKKPVSKMDIMQELVRKLGSQYAGLQKDGTVIHCAKGGTLKKAKNNAKKEIRELLESKIEVIGIQAKELPYGGYIVAIRGKKLEPTTKPAPPVKELPEKKERHHRFTYNRYGPGHIFVPNHKKPLKRVSVFIRGYSKKLRRTADWFWKAYKLRKQFRNSGMKGFFIMPEAPKYHGESLKERRWWKNKSPRERDLPGLIQYSQNYAFAKAMRNGLNPIKLDPNHKAIVISHSGGYMTASTWLKNKNVKVVVLQDSLYGLDKEFEEWAKKDGNLLILMPAGKVIPGVSFSCRKRTKRLARRFKKKAYFAKKRPRDFSDDEIKALKSLVKNNNLKVLHLEVPYYHGDIPRYTTEGVLKLIDELLDSDK